MIMLKRLAFFVIVGIIVVGGFEIGGRLAIPGVHSVIPTAEAVVGRPLTPVSVAGVARRQDRRD
jgi:hypothetical protein